MRYISIILFLFILISGCTKDVPLTSPKKLNTDTVLVSTFPLSAPTYGWEKVNLNIDVAEFAFDSQRNIYFISSYTKLIHADENFIIKDTLTVPSSDGLRSVLPFKIFINENDILFLAEGNGFNDDLFVSNDKGKTWFSPTGFHSTQILNFSSKGNKVYITSSGSDESAGMVQISEDNGKNWRTIINSEGSEHFDFCIENGFNEIFFMGNGSLYYSNDYGYTFTQRNLNFKYLYDYSIAFGFNNDLVFGTESGIYLTKDGGLTWQSIYTKTDFVYFFTLFNSGSGLIYAMHRWENGYSDSGLKGVYISRDGGLTWYTYLSQPEGSYYGAYQLGKDGYLYIVCSVNNGNKLYKSSVKL